MKNGALHCAPESINDALFTLLVSSVKDYAIFMISPNGHIMSWNNGAEYIKGYAQDEIIGKHISIFYTVEDNATDEPSRNLKAALNQGRYENNGWRLKKDGSKFWANVVLAPVYNDQSEHIGFAEVTQDITEKKRIEDRQNAINKSLAERVMEQEARRERTEVRFKKLIENSYDGIALLDESFMVLYRSRSAERINGWDDLERGSYTYADLVHPEDWPMVQRILKKVLVYPEQPVRIAFRLKHKSGEYRWQECLYTNMLADIHVNAIVCNFRDINEQKLAEQEIQNKAHQIEHILDRITDGFIALDSELRYTYVNNKVCKMVNRKPHELLGKKIWDVFPDVVGSKTYQAIMKAYNEQVYVCNEDFYAPQMLWQENHIYPSDEGLSIFIRDISEKKLTEKQINQQHIELNEAIEQQDTILNALPPHIALLDTHGTIITVNDGWRKFIIENHIKLPNYGIGSKYFSIAGKIIGPDKRLGHRIEGCINEVIFGRKKEFTTEYLCRLGSTAKWYQMVVAPLSNSRLKGVVVLHIDITERKLAEESVLRSQADMHSVFENTSLSIMLLNNDLKITAFNNNARELAIKSFGRKLRKGSSVFLYFPPDRKDIIQYSIGRAKKGELVRYEVLYDFPGGGSEWYEVKWVNIKNHKRGVVGIILTVDNITARKHQEAEINRQYEVLRNVAWIGSHEIRRPVASIMGLLYLLRMTIDSEEKDELMEMVGQCANELDQLVHLINDKINKDELLNPEA